MKWLLVSQIRKHQITRDQEEENLEEDNREEDDRAVKLCLFKREPKGT